MKRTLSWLLGLCVFAMIAVAVSWLVYMPPKAVRGVWQTEGYGLVLDVSATTIDVYQTSDLHCHRDMRIPAHLWLVNFLEGATFTQEGDRLKIALSEGLNPVYADPIGTLPTTCTAPPEVTAQATFDVMWDVMNTHYAHFDTHGVDWAARKSFRPDPQANDATLWKALQDALSGLDDGHTYLAASDQVWSPAITPVWHNNRHLMRDTTLATVADISEPNAFGLQAGFAAPGIGYVFMAHMDPDTALGQTPADAATNAFGQIIDYFQANDTKALILDLRYNPGGTDNVSMAYAGFFTQSTLPVFRKQTRTTTGMTAPFTATLAPQDTHWPGPVILLTTGYTASAAEIFTLAMRELPQVVTLGEPTSGGLSDVMTTTLPNGWVLGLSNQVYETNDGGTYEATGIPPDVPFPVDIPAAQAGTDTMLAAAIARLQESP